MRSLTIEGLGTLKFMDLEKGVTSFQSHQECTVFRFWLDMREGSAGLGTVDKFLSGVYSLEAAFPGGWCDSSTPLFPSRTIWVAVRKPLRKPRKWWEGQMEFLRIAWFQHIGEKYIKDYLITRCQISETVAEGIAHHAREKLFKRHPNGVPRFGEAFRKMVEVPKEGEVVQIALKMNFQKPNQTTRTTTIYHIKDDEWWVNLFNKVH